MLRQGMNISSPLLPTQNNGGYASFVFFKPHVSSAESRENVAWSLLSFYTYVGYHIKCSKAQMHQVPSSIINHSHALVISLLSTLSFDLPRE